MDWTKAAGNVSPDRKAKGTARFARTAALLVACLLGVHAIPAFAHDGAADVANSGDTAWLLACALLALAAGLPGIALFFIGRSPARSVLSFAMQTAAIAMIVPLAWIVTGYTFAFGEVGNGWIGRGNAWMLIGLGNVREGLEVPESAFVFYQVALATLGACILVGAWAGRARFGFAVVFAGFWSIAVLGPISHWLRGGGWLFQGVGADDFAGGLSVVVPAGVSGLVVAALLGRRNDALSHEIQGLGPAVTLAGGLLLGIAFIALSGGAAMFATDDAASALLATYAAAAAGGLTRLAFDRARGKKPSALSLAAGIIAGAAAALAGAVYVSPGGAILLGAAGALGSRAAAVALSRFTPIDDAFGTFATFAVPAAIGAMLIALLQAPALGGVGYDEGMNVVAQGVAQIVALVVVIAWSALVSVILALAVAMFLPMRVSEDAEAQGLDIASHGQRA